MTAPDNEERGRFKMQPPVLKALTSLLIMIFGTATVVILALAHVIQDGETIAALSAVMSASVGSHALNRKDNTDA